MSMPKKVRSAILIIDFINLFDFDSAAQLAARAVSAAKNTAKLKALATQRKIPCIYINDNFGKWTRPFDSLVKECLAKTGPSREIANVLIPTSIDVSILKPRHSAFYGTPLEFILEELKVSRLIITGISADNCVFATAQDAYVRQFELRIPADCVAANALKYERTVLSHMSRTLKADVRAAKWEF